jgi:2-amino-4-hydroxy-6-hydroxymethyldihydropteridine diphosphokinase
MATAFVSIGSNVDRERNITRALELLLESYGPLRASSVYESESVGFTGDPFFNLVVGFETDEEPCDVVRGLRDIECRCGRVRGGPRFGARTIDLDLLLLGDVVLRENGLVLPRDEITSLAFVLCPLAEIAAERRHPVLGEDLATLWANFDRHTQRLWRVEFDPLGCIAARDSGEARTGPWG